MGRPSENPAGNKTSCLPWLTSAAHIHTYTTFRCLWPTSSPPSSPAHGTEVPSLWSLKPCSWRGSQNLKSQQQPITKQGTWACQLLGLGLKMRLLTFSTPLPPHGPCLCMRNLLLGFGEGEIAPRALQGQQETGSLAGLQRHPHLLFC